MIRYRRYSGSNDKHLGPYITYGKSNLWKPWSIILSSGGGEWEDARGNHLKLMASGAYLIIELPTFLKHFENPKGSWDNGPREYGVQLGEEGHLQVFYGPQTHDSTTTKSWSKFLPWTQWRFVRHSIYNIDGSHHWTAAVMKGHDRFGECEKARDTVTKRRFAVVDYDDDPNSATCYIEEREWKFGEGWFKWLSLFRKPSVKRTLDIRFEKEVGPEKGSWKGGLIGTGIEMMPGEDAKSAFIRYCEQEHRSKGGKYKISFAGEVAL